MMKVGNRVAIYGLPIAMILIMMITPIHAWSGDRPSHDSVPSNWLFSYEKPPVGNNPNGPVTDFNEQSFSDSRIRLSTELVSYTQNSGGTAQNPLDKYTFRLMASATSRPDHVMPAPSYKSYSDINQCPSRGSTYCIDTGINTKNGGKWVDITWPFNFYGQVFTKVFICSSGYVAFVYVPTATSCPTPNSDLSGNYQLPGAAFDSNGNFLGVPSSVTAPYMKPFDASWHNAKIYYTVYVQNDPLAPLVGTYGHLTFGVTWYKVQTQGAFCNSHGCSDCYPCENTFSLTFDSDGNIFFWWDTSTSSTLNVLDTPYGVMGVNDASGTMSTLGSANTAHSGGWTGLYMRDPNYDIDWHSGYPQYNAWLNDLKVRFSDSNSQDTLNPTGGGPWYGKDIQSSPSSTKCDASCQALGKIALFALVQGICVAVTDGLCLVAEAADLGIDVGQPFLASMPVATFNSHVMNCQGGATGCIDDGVLELPAVQQDGNCNCATDSSVYLSQVEWIVPHDSATHSLTIRFGAELGTFQGGNSFSDTSNTRGWATITLTADAGDFTISASPKSGTVLQGSSSNFNVNLFLNNLAAIGTPISLSTNLPDCSKTTGLCASFSPASVFLNPGQSGTSTMTLYAGSGASPGGPTAVTITGTDPTTALMHSSQVSVTVVQPDFTISANPASINAYSGSPGTSTLTLASLNTFSGNVILATNAPTGFTATVNPSSVSVPSGGTASSTLTVSVSGSPAAGSYTVTVTGSSGSLSHPVYISVSYTGTDFSISASPTSVSESAATGVNSAITLTSLNNFAGTVALSVTFPSNATVSGVTYLYWQWNGCSTSDCTLSQTLSSGGTATATLTLWSYSNTPVGNYVVTVTGTSGSLAHSVTITLTVTLYAGGGGGGGGSLAEGTMITMANGSNMGVQNIKVGDQLLGYDPITGAYGVSTVTAVKIVHTSTLLVIHTGDGATLRTDASPTEVLWTRLQNGASLWLPVTRLQNGDDLWTQNGWVPVTSITSVSSGQHTMYDITATLPYFANGYLDPPHPS